MPKLGDVYRDFTGNIRVSLAEFVEEFGADTVLEYIGEEKARDYFSLRPGETDYDVQMSREEFPG